MKLYTSVGPNPKVVRMFMAEKGIELPKVEVDIRGGENRREPYLSKNPSGQSPALELDNGTVLAETRMWARRIDLGILEPMANGFRYAEGLKMFQNRIHCIPQAANDLKQTAQEKLKWLDGLMGGKQFVCGNRLTLADILLFAFVDFFAGVGQPINPELKNIVAWHARMKARPSAAA